MYLMDMIIKINCLLLNFKNCYMIDNFFYNFDIFVK